MTSLCFRLSNHRRPHAPNYSEGWIRAPSPSFADQGLRSKQCYTGANFCAGLTVICTELTARRDLRKLSGAHLAKDREWPTDPGIFWADLELTSTKRGASISTAAVLGRCHGHDYSAVHRGGGHCGDSDSETEDIPLSKPGQYVANLPSVFWMRKRHVYTVSFS